MPDINLVRHQMIFDATEYANLPIHIIGAGATGSRVWLALVELGLTNIQTYDFDKVEDHNLANQIYLNEDVGQYKVHALKRYYKRKTGKETPSEMGFHTIKVDHEFFDTTGMPGIVFLLTDTMASRREIFQCVIRNRSHDSKTAYMIETRMASSYGNIFGVNPFDPAEAEYWLSTLADDDAETTEVSACGASISVGPTASIIANMAVWQMIMFLNDPLAVTTEISLFCKPMMYLGKTLERADIPLEAIAPDYVGMITPNLDQPDYGLAA